MKSLLFDCSYSDVWASPKDWKTTTAKSSLKKEWYVQCYFYDPIYKLKYPKGKPYRVKLNKFKTLEERKAAIEFYLKEIPRLFEEEGFNPITKKFMIEPKPATNNKKISAAGPEMPFYDALQHGYSKLSLAQSTTDDINYILLKLKTAIDALEYDVLPIKDISRSHIRNMIDYLEIHDGVFSGHKFNKYRSYLLSIYNELFDREMVESNIIKDIRKKKVIKNIREVLTLEERTLIYNYLEPRFPEFLDFSILFFHSGGRIIELLNLKVSELDLKKKRYKTLIKKGTNYKWKYRPIKDIAIPVWEKVLSKNKYPLGDNFVFSVGLIPGPKTIRYEQIGRRWKTHVKNKLGITADFYALKHSNLDEIAAKLSMKDAAKAAGHDNTDMVEKHYALGEEERAMKRISSMDNEFAPLRAV